MAKKKEKDDKEEVEGFTSQEIIFVIALLLVLLRNLNH